MKKQSKIIGDEPCPECRKNGHDKTGNHLIIFEDGGKHCNRCGYHEQAGEKKPMPQKKLCPQTHFDMFQPVDMSLRGDGIRGISAKTCKRFNVYSTFDSSSGDILCTVYTYSPNTYKVRILPKDFIVITKKDNKFIYGGKLDNFFGQSVYSKQKSDTLLIVGGEEDCLAAYEMLQAAFPINGAPDVVSLPNGESSLKVFTNQHTFVNRYRRIIVATDMDAVGREATMKIADLIGPKTFIASMPAKDANDCLLQGLSKEFVDSIMSAQPYKPSGILSVADVYEDALKKPVSGVSWPWPTLTQKTYGIRGGEGYYIGAGVKVGKSEFVNELTSHLISIGEKVFLIKAEEKPAKTAKRLAGKMAGKLFHVPDIEYDPKELEDNLKKIDGKVNFYNRHNHLDWEEVKVAIRHQVIVDGVKHVFLDPVTCLTDGMESGDANTFLQKFSREMDEMAKDLDFTYYVFCHLNAPHTGRPHERGGKVESYQFTGSRAMMRACSYMIGIERNKDPDLEERERNTSYFVLLEDREFGNTARFPVYYDRDTGDYLEPKTAF